MPERRSAVDAGRIGVDTGERDKNLVTASQDTSETETPSCSASSPDVAKVDAQPQVHSAWWCSAYAYVIQQTCDIMSHVWWHPHLCQLLSAPRLSTVIRTETRSPGNGTAAYLL